jgi:glycosyltransferase involved in cell wall biosynthesis
VRVVRVVRVVTRLNRGGPLSQFLGWLPRLREHGVEGEVLAGTTEEGEEDGSDLLRAAGVEVVAVPGLRRSIAPGDDLRAYRWIRERLRRQRPDVVHTHLAKAGALGRLAAAAEGVPVRVHTFHGHHFTAPFLRGRAAVVAERRLARRTTALVCQSRSQRDDVVERFHVAPAEKAWTIAPGLDLAALRAAVDPARAAAIRATHAPGARALVLWLGRFVPVKEPKRLVDALALALARAKGGGASFAAVLAGDGPLLEETRAHAARLGLAGDVAFPGPVADAASWIAAADLVVLASRSEGTPISLIEAQALSRPVVSTDVGGVRDVVDDGATGILVPPAAADDGAAPLARAIATLVADPEARRAMGARGRSWADERFSADRTARETAALYEGCLLPRSSSIAACRPIPLP